MPSGGIDRIADIFAGLTGLAVIAVIVGSPNTRRIITAIGSSYATAVSAAMGRR